MKKQISIKKLVIISVVLSLVIFSKFIEMIVPDLPNGLGNIFKLSEIILFMSAIIFGFSVAFVAINIYLIIIAPIFSGFFLSGIFYIDGITNQIAIYFLDYFIPLNFLTFIAFFNSKKSKQIFFYAYLIIFIILLSHTISGYVFFKNYLNPVIKNELFYFLLSFGLNLLGYIILFIGLPLYCWCSLNLKNKILKDHILKNQYL
ncbi:hypothetical protein [Mesomycoplasma lagogenitalium]|uniref:ECF transporter S component n=1 Tax=Mesomycoplasma lagogenitalium TaxID=171286 RepID=A0ABY8LWV1_9BACT|nr:hypothetical protein [Mesomycoplasma lagogenitalium]WGI37048.1 hypothetical protein QEG99_02075 [Mesomycoplasma lagogenitalium]